jgi:predicted transcriptional regulator
MPYNSRMGKSHDLIARIDADTSADLDRLAAEWNCTREQIATTAILRFLDEETRHWPTEFDDLPAYVETDPLAVALNEAEQKAAEALHAYLKVGEDAAERGELISQEEMERWFAERVAARKRSAAAE